MPAAAPGDQPGQVVEIFTDGACQRNPGPGGWGTILRFGLHQREMHGGDPATTNNRMELMAAIQGLESLTLALGRAPVHRQPVPAPGHHRVAARVEAQRLADQGQEAGQERRPADPACTRLPADATCSGSGSRATLATRRTSAPMRWPAAAPRRPPQQAPTSRRGPGAGDRRERLAVTRRLPPGMS